MVEYIINQWKRKNYFDAGLHCEDMGFTTN